MREQKRALVEMQKELDTSQSRYDELDNIIQHLYEDKIKGQLTDERFTKLSAGYEAEQKGLEETIKALSEQIAKLLNCRNERKEKSRREIPPTYIPLFGYPYRYYTFGYLYFNSPNCSYSIVLLFPLRYPIKLDTEILGGISTRI